MKLYMIRPTRPGLVGKVMNWIGDVVEFFKYSYCRTYHQPEHWKRLFAGRAVERVHFGIVVRSHNEIHNCRKCMTLRPKIVIHKHAVR